MGTDTGTQHREDLLPAHPTRKSNACPRRDKRTSKEKEVTDASGTEAPPLPPGDTEGTAVETSAGLLLKHNHRTPEGCRVPRQGPRPRHRDQAVKNEGKRRGEPDPGPTHTGVRSPRAPRSTPSPARQGGQLLASSCFRCCSRRASRRSALCTAACNRAQERESWLRPGAEPQPEGRGGRG